MKLVSNLIFVVSCCRDTTRCRYVINPRVSNFERLFEISSHPLLNDKTSPRISYLTFSRIKFVLFTVWLLKLTKFFYLGWKGPSRNLAPWNSFVNKLLSNTAYLKTLISSFRYSSYFRFFVLGLNFCLNL